MKLKQGLCINLEGWDGEEDGKEVQKGGYICIPIADSCWSLTEKSNYPSIENKLIKKIQIFKKEREQKSKPETREKTGRKNICQEIRSRKHNFFA